MYAIDQVVLETDIDALSSHNSDPSEPEVWDANGKTLEEIATCCEAYERGNRRQMARRRRMGLAGIERVPLH